jgi:hypothetical protein
MQTMQTTMKPMMHLQPLPHHERRLLPRRLLLG